MGKGGLGEIEEEDFEYLIDWCGQYWDMGRKYGDGKNGKARRKIFEVGIGSRGKNTGIFSKGRVAKG